MKKSLYLGVDQTGAVDYRGRPRPLPSCLIAGNKVSFFYLNRFSRTDIEQQIPISKKIELRIAVDCVIGLPCELSLNWREITVNIPENSGYGRQAASHFFKQMGKGRILHRRVELEVRANSVFQERPYQKNIQTGSFRLWKEIGQSADGFCFPFLGETPTEKTISVYEGYPSLSWKILFHVNKRQPESIEQLIQEHFPRLVLKPKDKRLLKEDANLADAFVLAMTLKKFSRDHTKLNVSSEEGWILGHPYKTTKAGAQ